MLESHELYKIEIRLIAVHTLYEERILRPVHSREILVRRRPPIISPPFDLDSLPRRHVANEQVHHGIWPSGARIALFDDADLIRLYVEAWYDVDRGFVHARIGDIAVVGAPPVTGETMHLLLGHEFGDTVGNGLVRLGGGGEAGLFTAGQVNRVERPVAYKTGIPPARRDLRIRLESVAVGQLAHLRRPLAKCHQEQVAAHRHEQRVRRAPIVIDNAFCACDPLALARGFLHFGEFCFDRLKKLRINQAALLARFHVKLPEIEPVLFVRAAFEEGHALAVGREFYPPWSRS